ncbi:MAG TPA: tetratricopeptide repeat protein [Thermoanaerobaculia bacterium]|nr:tetratricopeptide repeat protein [Thermoanaerobaculia bacterium]
MKAVFVFAALPLLAQTVDVQQTIREGIALYDQRRYDEAIAKYKTVLAQEPSNVDAVYELGYTYQTKGDAAACIALLTPWSDKPTTQQSALRTILANCLDNAGRRDEAIALYRKTLEVEPNHPQLLYNLALTLSSGGDSELDEARALLKKELSAIRPNHASARYLLGRIFEVQQFRVPAILEYLRFLAIEPNGPRAKEAATRMLTLLNLGVEKKGRNTNVTIDSNPRKEEGDYSTWAMMLAIASAARDLPEKPKRTDFERTRAQLYSTLMMFVESGPEGHADYTATANFPFFAELQQRKLLEALSGAALLSLDLKGEDEWLKKNEKEVGELAAFTH